MPRMRPVVSVFLSLLYFFPAMFAGAQSVTPPAYTSVVIFGDSLCDTGNDGYISSSLYTVNAQVPGPATGYTNGRFTDGTDTLPAAHNYYGVWIEQLAAMFTAKPAINYSLNPVTPGMNYAYGFASTNTGTTLFTYGPGNALSFSVNNMATQVASYLAKNPVINNKTLFVVWGGANDLIAATSSSDIQNAALRDAGIVQTLINAGATDFIIPNLPALGLVPRFNGSVTTSAPATAAAAGFDQYLAAYLAALPAANPGKTLHLYTLDTYTLFNTIIAAPTVKGFANVTASAQGNTAINPDTYLFWDDLHPTTFGHSQLAASAYTLLTGPYTTTSSVSTSNYSPNLNGSVTLTANVGATASAPMGSIAFYDGMTLLGSSVAIPITASGTGATASFTTSSLAAGTHSITAQFAGVNGYGSSSSTPISVTVVAPALQTAIQYSTLTITSGSTGTDQVAAIAVGGYTGTATFGCTNLPAHMTCTFAPASAPLVANNPVVSTLTIGTAGMASLTRPSFHGLGGRSSETVLACMLLPGFGLLGFSLSRRRRLGTQRLAVGLCAFALLGVPMLALSGCASNNDTAKGTYNIQVTIAANSTTQTQNLAVTVQ